jgi:hypothetical protein
MNDNKLNENLKKKHGFPYVLHLGVEGTCVVVKNCYII